MHRIPSTVPGATQRRGRPLLTTLVCRIALCALPLAVAQAPPPAAAATQICGDFDGSGSVAATDALLLLKHAVGQAVSLSCPDCSTLWTRVATGEIVTAACGDVDGSGSVAATDALRLLRHAIGQPVDVGCPCPYPETTTTTVIAAGTIDIPPDFPLDPGDLSVSTNGADAPVADDGEFAVEVLSQDPTLVYALDEGGRIVLMGFVEPGSAGSIDVDSTAVALLYFALGAYTMPAEDLDELLDLLAADPATAALVTATAGALTANPLAINQADAALLAAVAGARDAILLAAPSLIASQRPAAKLSVSTPGGIRTDPGPGVTQSGVEMVVPEGSGQVVPRNTWPRRGVVLAYRTGLIDDAGGELPTNPPQPVGTSDLRVTRQASGVLDSLDRYLAALGAFEPQDGDPISLPLVAGSSRTLYELIALGPALDRAPPPLLSEPRYAGFQADWASRLAETQEDTFITDFLVPVVVPVAFGSQYSYRPDAVVDLLEELRPTIVPLVASFALQTQGGMRGATMKALDEVAQDPTLLETVVREVSKILIRPPSGAPGLRRDLNVRETTIAQGKIALARLAETGALFAAIDGGLAGEDVGGNIRRLRAASQADLWQAEVGRVEISPKEVTLTREDPSATFTASANLEGLGSPPLLYRWRTPGAAGTLNELVGDGEGNEILTSQSQILYIADPGMLRDGQIDTVSVEVFVDDGTPPAANDEATVGEATAVVEGDIPPDTPCESFPVATFRSPLMEVSVSPQLVRPLDTLHVELTYNWGMEGADRSGSQTYSVWVQGMQPYFVGDGGVEFTAFGLQGIPGKVGIGPDGKTSYRAFYFNPPFGGFAQPFQDSDDEPFVGFQNGYFGSAIEIRISQPDLDPNAPGFQEPTSPQTHTIAMKTLNFQLEPGQEVCPFLAQTSSQGVYWTGPVVVADYAESFRFDEAASATAWKLIGPAQ